MNFRPFLFSLALALPASGMDFIKNLNATRFSAYGSSGMDFDAGTGELSLSSFDLRTSIGDPRSLPGNFTLFTGIRYEATFLDFDDQPAGFPVGDESLHSLQLPMFFVHAEPSSRWIYGAFLRLGLQSDLQSITFDDTFVDLGIGGGYRFNDEWTVGLGAGFLNALGDERFIAGPAVIWNPCDAFTLRLLGPTFTAGWTANENWRVSFDVRPSGGIWNLDTADGSRNLEIDSFRAGIHLHHQFTPGWWLELGTGITFANEVNVRTHGGTNTSGGFLGDLDNGYFGFIAVKRQVW